jgi:hypothetical protein
MIGLVNLLYIFDQALSLWGNGKANVLWFIERKLFLDGLGSAL